MSPRPVHLVGSIALLLAVAIASPASAQCDAECGDPCHGSCSVTPSPSSCGTACSGGGCATLTCQEHGSQVDCQFSTTWDCEEAGGGGGDPLEKNPSPPLTAPSPNSKPTEWALIEYQFDEIPLEKHESRVLAASSGEFAFGAIERIRQQEEKKRAARERVHARQGDSPSTSFEARAERRTRLWIQPPRGTCASLALDLAERAELPSADGLRGTVIFEVTVDRGGRAAAIRTLYSDLPGLERPLARHVHDHAFFSSPSGNPGPAQVYLAFRYHGSGIPSTFYAGARQLL